MSPSNYGEVECDEGFSRQGSGWIYCNADGVLIGELPTCERSCKDIKVPVGTTSMEFVAIAGDDNYGYLDVLCDDSTRSWITCTKGAVDADWPCADVPTMADPIPVQTVAPTVAEIPTMADPIPVQNVAPIVAEVAEDIMSTTEIRGAEEVKQNPAKYSGCMLPVVEGSEWTDLFAANDPGRFWSLSCNDGFKKEDSSLNYDAFCDSTTGKVTAMSQEFPSCSPIPNYNFCAGKQVPFGKVLATVQDSGWNYLTVSCDEGYQLYGGSGSYCWSVDGNLSSELGQCKK